MRIRTLAAALSALFIAAGCSRARPNTRGPSPAAISQTGTASWYGPGFQGKATSSGEIYDQNGMTAAHRTLPLGSIVRVTNTVNNKHVDVRINDRGPFVGDRIIDLSRAAASALDMIGPGTAVVRVDVVETPVRIESIPRAVIYTVQVASYAQRANADDLRATLARTFSDVRVVSASTNDGTRYRVQVGAFSSRERAQEESGRIARAGYTPAVVERW